MTAHSTALGETGVKYALLRGNAKVDVFAPLEAWRKMSVNALQVISKVAQRPPELLSELQHALNACVYKYFILTSE